MDHDVPFTEAEEKRHREADIANLIAAYRLSGSTPENGTLMGVLEVTGDGKVSAAGGRLAFLPILRDRKAELVAYLTHPCDDCGSAPATRGPVALDSARVCDDCFRPRAARALAEWEAEQRAVTPVNDAAAPASIDRALFGADGSATEDEPEPEIVDDDPGVRDDLDEAA